jgi:Delta24(24(1))-sterol reductase
LISKGIPSSTTWAAYVTFFVVQIILAAFVPGMLVEGVPINAEGKKLPYLCNGYLCYYICLYGVFFCHFVGILPGTYFCDYYGEFLVASMIISDVTSVFWYFYGMVTEPDLPRTGIVVYDFFMGTVLYPRIGIVDIKMIAECRWSWTTLMILTLSCAWKQYEQLGYVTREMGVMLVAHWLYSNATAKGEHCIPCTWDMFHEKFGWMLNFWNTTGVPFLYCFQSFYLLKNQKSPADSQPVWFIWCVYALLVGAYYIFDTANAHKASWKKAFKRNTFPQLPWSFLPDPARCVRTPKGDLLVDGWYAFGRKLQYTGDILMALSWGLACGFKSPLPYFYFVFFLSMINHRQWRDEVRCKEKYGLYWDIYTKVTPNVFVPDLGALFRFVVTGEMPPMKEGVTLVSRSGSAAAPAPAVSGKSSGKSSAKKTN